MIFWMLRRSLFRPFWPVWVPFMAYRYWRRLSPRRRDELKEHARRLRGTAAEMRRRALSRTV